MAMQFFVNPKNTTRLYPWGEGENKQWWIDVKDHLSAKEDKDVQAAGIPNMMAKTSGQADIPEDQREVKVGLDMGRMSIVRAAKSIVAWSLVDAEGHAMPLNEAAIGELTQDAFAAIDKALDEHKKAKEAQKKDDSGTTTLKSA